jgi:hypothetical protein
MTPHDLLSQIIDACRESSFVSAYAVRMIDLDILSLRVYLVDNTFIDVFYNTATDKTAFALIADAQRIYGKDNAKIGWHVHPLDAQHRHIPCQPVAFSDFLAEVETLRFS